MNSVKYSIPTNYIIQELNGFKGIIRRDKKGDKWTWQPFYKALLVSKTYGRIIVAYAEASSTESYLKLSSYDKKEHIPILAYDVIFGENFMYVKTIKPSTGELEWCLVRDDFKGGKFLGDFEFMGRSKSMPFHMPVNTLETHIKLPDEKVMKIKLVSGDIVEDESLAPKVEAKPVVEEVIPFYDVIINATEKKIQLLNPKTAKVVKESGYIGEIEQYADIIKSMLGKMDNVEREVADKLLDFFKLFESFVHGMALPIVFTYVKHRNSKLGIKEMLDAMIAEVTNGWFKREDGKEFKLYMQGTIFLAMSKTKNGKVTVAPYMLHEGDDLLSDDEMMALVNCYKANGFNTTRLQINDVTLDSTVTDEHELKEWPSPYSVRQRIAFASDISSFKYKQINLYMVHGCVLTERSEDQGELEITVALCEDFSYKPKKKVGGKPSEWVTTNTLAAQIC